jgi:small ligand-binding sensory domain FIST
MAGAKSFAVQTESPARVAREVALALGAVPRASGGVVFVAGRLVERMGELGRELAAVHAGVPLAVAPGAAVLSERGEIEGNSAAAGVIWAGGKCEVVALGAASADDAAEAVANALGDRTAQSAPTAIVFMRPEGISPQSLEPVARARRSPYVLGAGTVAADSLALGHDGAVTAARAVVMFVRGLSPPVIRPSPACKLLMPLRTITETRGSLVTRIESEPALDVLSQVGERLAGQPLVFAVLANPEADPAARPELLVRAVQGVDPVRRGLLIAEEAREGMRIAFAIRDPGAARADLESATRDVLRAAAGAAPRFGIYINCAGRGSGLYGAADVDTKILATRFPGVPFAGMSSSFEIAPHAGIPSLQLYTGVVALFTAPS